MQLGAWPALVGRRNSLTSEFWSLHFLHGLCTAAEARGDAPGGAAKPVVLQVQAAPSSTRGMGNPAAVRHFRRVPMGGPGHRTLQWTRTSKQTGRALRHRGILMLHRVLS